MKFSRQAFLDSDDCHFIRDPVHRHEEREGHQRVDVNKFTFAEQINVEHISWRSSAGRNGRCGDEGWESVADSVQRTVRDFHFVVGKWTQKNTRDEVVVEEESLALRKVHRVLRDNRLQLVVDRITIPMGVFLHSKLLLNDDSVRSRIGESLEYLTSLARALCPRFVVADIHVLELSECTFTPFFAVPGQLHCSCSTVISVMTRGGILSEDQVTRWNVQQTFGFFELGSISREETVAEPPCYTGEAVSVFMKPSLSDPVTFVSDGGFTVFDSEKHFFKFGTGSLNGAVAVLLLRICDCGNSKLSSAPTDDLKFVWEENILRYKQHAFLANGILGQGNTFCPQSVPRLCGSIPDTPELLAENTPPRPKIKFECCEGRIHKGQNFFQKSVGTPVFLLAGVSNRLTGDHWEEVCGIGRIVETSYHENARYVRVHGQQFDLPFVLVQVDVLRRDAENVPFATVFHDSTGRKVELMKDVVPASGEIYPWDASLLQVQLFSTTEITDEDKAFSFTLSSARNISNGGSRR